METNACYRDVESCRYYNMKYHLFSLIISTNMLLIKVHVLHLPFTSSYTSSQLLSLNTKNVLGLFSAFLPSLFVAEPILKGFS